MPQLDFYAKMEKEVGKMNFAIKEALKELGYQSEVNYALFEEQQLPGLMVDLAAQIVKFANGEGDVDAKVVDAAQAHLKTLGYDTADYKVPFKVNIQVRSICRKVKTIQEQIAKQFDFTAKSAICRMCNKNLRDWGNKKNVFKNRNLIRHLENEHADYNDADNDFETEEEMETDDDD